jgi:hypothetical protein
MNTKEYQGIQLPTSREMLLWVTWRIEGYKLSQITNKNKSEAKPSHTVRRTGGLCSIEKAKRYNKNLYIGQFLFYPARSAILLLVVKGSLSQTEILIYQWFIFGTYGSKKKQSGIGYH